MTMQHVSLISWPSLLNQTIYGYVSHVKNYHNPSASVYKLWHKFLVKVSMQDYSYEEVCLYQFNYIIDGWAVKIQLTTILKSYYKHTLTITMMK